MDAYVSLLRRCVRHKESQHIMKYDKLFARRIRSKSLYSSLKGEYVSASGVIQVVLTIPTKSVQGSGNRMIHVLSVSDCFSASSVRGLVFACAGSIKLS